MSPGALRREIALGAALALLVSLGWWFYRTQETSFRNQVEAELVAVGHLKVDQLKDWRRERFGDGAALASNPFFRTAVPDWIRRPSSPSGELLRSLETLRRHYRYEDILLTDPGGRVLWSFGASRKVLAPAAREVLASALQARAPRLTDLHDPDSPHLGVVVPFFSSSGTPAGALVLVQDARKTLYPLLQSWPLPSDTAETLLVRREGDQGVLLQVPQDLAPESQENPLSPVLPRGGGHGHPAAVVHAGLDARAVQDASSLLHGLVGGGGLHHRGDVPHHQEGLLRRSGTPAAQNRQERPQNTSDAA